MTSSRRRFLQQAGIALAACATSVPAMLSAATAAPTAEHEFAHARFAPHLHSDFQVSLEDGSTHTLRLAEIIRLSNLQGYADKARAAEGCFTLVFDSAQHTPIAEGIVTFHHPRCGRFVVFMSPIRGNARSYQVAFNRA